MSLDQPQDAEDPSLEEVSLDGEKPTVERKTLQCRRSELSGMMRRLSSQAVVLTRSLTDSLHTECAIKPEPGRGITRRQSLIMSRIIDPLETEEVDDNNSVTSYETESSDFVGGGLNKRVVMASALNFRHQLSIQSLNLNLS